MLQKSLMYRLQSRLIQLGYLYRVQHICLNLSSHHHSAPRRTLSSTRTSLASRESLDGVVKPFTPKVDPQLIITSDPLPPDIQRAVDEHTKAIWQPKAQNITEPSRSRVKTTLNRNMFRHWQIDGRKNLKKHKKRLLRTEFEITPFVILGAHRALVNRLEARTGDTENKTAQSILNEKIPFRWFETGAMAVGKQGFALPEKKSDLARLIIVHELMAMTMRPVLAPYLPPHAWCLQDDTRNVSPVENVQSIASSVDYDTAFHEYLIWDMRDNKDDRALVLESVQFKSMLNVVRPYVSSWWPELLNGIFNLHGKGSKKSRKWNLSNDSCSSLPAVLTDLLFLRLDVLIADREPKLRDQLRSRLKKLESNVNPDEERVTDYHRVGPVVLVTFHGPESLREKQFRFISFQLKSSLYFNIKGNETDECFTLVLPHERKRKNVETKNPKKVMPKSK